MRLEKIQDALRKKNIIFTYTEDEGRGSLDFQFRGLRYHIWEFEENGEAKIFWEIMRQRSPSWYWDGQIWRFRGERVTKMNLLKKCHPFR